MSKSKINKPLRTKIVQDSEGNDVVWTLHEDGVYSYTDRFGVEHRYKYLNLLNDKIFKIVFGTPGREELMIAFLNRVILGPKIKSLKYLNTEHWGPTFEDRGAFFDLLCENEDGEKFVVEIQNYPQEYYNKRSVYYASRVILDQATEENRRQKSEEKYWNYFFKPVYVVSLLNYRIEHEDPTLRELKSNPYIYRYNFREEETKECLKDGTTLIHVELAEFNKTAKELSGDMDKWLYALKNISKFYERPESLDGPEMDMLYESAKMTSFGSNDLLNIHRCLMNENDRIMYECQTRERNIREGREEGLKIGREEGLKEGREEGKALGRAEGLAEGLAEGRLEGLAEGRLEGRVEGRAEGRAEGLEEGRRAAKIEMAKALQEAGMTKEQIMSITGLEESDIV